MAAALATIRILRDTTASHISRHMGQRLRRDWIPLAARHGFNLRQTGPAQMPMVLFDGDPSSSGRHCFCASALRHGIYLHPKHNMFLSAAHAPADVDRILTAAEAGFAAVAREAAAG